MDKKIIIMPKENNKSAKPSEKKKRTIVSTVEWIKNINEHELLFFLQNNQPSNKEHKLLHKELQKKLSSYSNQDKKKKLYNQELFITMKHVINKLLDCNLACFYCSEKVKVLYENIREPKQWSLERIDNDYGHNSNNVEISCLHCNVQRKTMNYEKYKFTKELTLIKKDI